MADNIWSNLEISKKYTPKFSNLREKSIIVTTNVDKIYQCKFNFGKMEKSFDKFDIIKFYKWHEKMCELGKSLVMDKKIRFRVDLE